MKMLSLLTFLHSCLFVFVFQMFRLYACLERFIRNVISCAVNQVFSIVVSFDLKNICCQEIIYIQLFIDYVFNQSLICNYLKNRNKQHMQFCDQFEITQNLTSIQMLRVKNISVLLINVFKLKYVIKLLKNSVHFLYSKF